MYIGSKSYMKDKIAGHIDMKSGTLISDNMPHKKKKQIQLTQLQRLLDTKVALLDVDQPQDQDTEF